MPTNRETTVLPHDLAEKSSARPQWSRPDVDILDVETGTLAVTGPAADGSDGSTS